MAIFPCDICRKRYPGRGNTVYVGWMAGGYNDRVKYNACPFHADQLTGWAAKHLQLIEVGGVMQTDDTEVSKTCSDCGLEPATQTWFANTYLRTEDPKTFAAGFCEKCGARVGQDRPQAA